MKEERSDKLIREKIDELALSKNNGFDKQASWQKLETMLPPKQNNKAWMYYVAAAIVLIISASLLLNKPVGNNIVVNKVEVPKQKAITKHDVAVKDITPWVHVKKDIKKSAAKLKKQPDNNIVQLPVAEVKEAVQNEDNINEESKIVTALNTNASAPDNRQKPTAKTLIPKQKFRIIHINEMEDKPVSTGIAKQSPAIKIKVSFFKPALPLFINPDEIPTYAAPRTIKKGGLFETSLSN